LRIAIAIADGGGCVIKGECRHRLGRNEHAEFACRQPAILDGALERRDRADGLRKFSRSRDPASPLLPLVAVDHIPPFPLFTDALLPGG
jgi:hypothetical protein